MALSQAAAERGRTIGSMKQKPSPEVAADLAEVATENELIEADETAGKRKLKVMRRRPSRGGVPPQQASRPGRLTR